MCENVILAAQHKHEILDPTLTSPCTQLTFKAKLINLHQTQHLIFVIYLTQHQHKLNHMQNKTNLYYHQHQLEQIEIFVIYLTQ